MSDYEKMTGDKKISEIETLIDINGEEKVLVAYNGQNNVISVARLINDGHTHSYTQLNDLQDLMDIVDAQYQHKKDSTLPTESKEVSGAITEIYNLISQLNDEELESLKNQLQDLTNQVEDNSSQLAHIKTYNILDYGAKGDGSDNSIPLNNNAFKTIKELIIENKGGVIEIPYGNFKISDTITFDGINQLKITGKGYRSTLYFVNGSQGINIKNLQYGGLITELNIISNYTANYGIVMDSCHSFNISHIRIRGFLKTGLQVEGCYCSTYWNIDSSENLEYGIWFKTKGKEPYNNSISINDCCVGKNGKYNLQIDDGFVYNINRLNCEQFDIVEYNDSYVQTDGSINLISPSSITINGLYYEAYKRREESLFKDTYCFMKLGDVSLSKTVSNISINGCYISNNSYDLVGLQAEKIRLLSIDTSIIKRCSTGLKSYDINNTISIGDSVSFELCDYQCSNVYKMIKKDRIGYSSIFSPVLKTNENNTSLILKCDTKTYVNRILIYYISDGNDSNYNSIYIKSTNGYSTQTNLSRNKSKLSVITVDINQYFESGSILYCDIEGISTALADIQICCEYIETL